MCSLSLSQSSASKHSCTMAFNTRPVEGASEACSGMHYNVGGGGGGGTRAREGNYIGHCVIVGVTQELLRVYQTQNGSATCRQAQ